MAVFVFSDFGATTLEANISTTPAAGTLETWTLVSTLGSPALPQITAGQQFTATVYSATDTDPEIVLVTQIISSTQVTVSRGYNGIVKIHSAGDNFVNTITAEFLNNLTLSSGALLAANNLSDLGNYLIARANFGVPFMLNSASVSGTSYTVPSPNTVPYYTANYLTLGASLTAIDLPAPFVGLDILMAICQGPAGGHPYYFTDPSNDIADSSSSTTSANEVDVYRFLCFDGINYLGLYMGPQGIGGGGGGGGGASINPYTATVGAALTIPSGYTAAFLTCTQAAGVITLRHPGYIGDWMPVTVHSASFTYSIGPPGGCVLTVASGLTPQITTGTDEYLLISPDGTNWLEFPSGQALMNVASLVEPVYVNASATGEVTLQDPATTAWTVQRYVVPNGDTLTLVNFPVGTTSQCKSVVVQIETGTTPVVNFPTTNTQWAGQISAAGSAPVLPASSKTQYVVKCLDGVNFEWAFAGRYV